MKQFLKSLLSDINGNISSKRVAFLIVLVLFITLSLEISLGKMKFVPEVWEGVRQTLWFLGGFVTSEYLTQIIKK